MNIAFQEVNCRVRHEIPSENETIADDFDIDLMCEILSGINVYRREKEHCPYARGNWMIDFIVDGRASLCLKLPLEMTEQQIDTWIKPLTDRLELVSNENDKSLN